MISPYDLRDLIRKHNLMLREEFTSYLEELLDDAENTFLCEIVWCTEDIEAVFQNSDITYCESKVQSAKSYVAKHLTDRSIEEGWGIMETLLAHGGYLD